MSPDVRTRIRIEAGLAVLSGFLFVLTLVSRDWIEAVFPIDPDRQSGALEWASVGAFLLAAVVSGTLARAEWRRLA